jgi:RND family efflux transporter MFP subunit
MHRRLITGTFLISMLIAAVWLVMARHPVHVQVAKVEMGPAVELVYATGYVDAEHPVSVSARITAPVRAVLVREGDRVVSGQPLLVQDNSEQLGLLAQAEAQARGATRAERRIGSLFAKGWVTRAARDETVANGEASRASAMSLRARLDQLTVRAGVTGIVLKRDVEPGDLATPGKELMQLGDPAHARVTATVDERDIPRIHDSQPVLMSTDALPGRIIRGHVVQITPGGDPNQRAFRIRIGLSGTEELPFGLTLEVNIVTQHRDNVLLVPAGAVSDGKIWLVNDGRARRRAIRTGISGTDKVEIRSGLSPSDIVIVDPPEDLEEGERVSP